MVSQCWDLHLKPYNLRNLARLYCTGASFQLLPESVQNLGYEALSVRAILSKLDSYYNPCIAHWQVIIYVVVWRDKSDRILISDPAIGNDWLSSPELEPNSPGSIPSPFFVVFIGSGNPPNAVAPQPTNRDIFRFGEGITGYNLIFSIDQVLNILKASFL